MPRTVTRICPSCGGALEFAADLERLACEHCGAELIVRRRGALVSLAPAPEAEAPAGPGSPAAEPCAAQPEDELQKLRAQVARLRLERDVQALKAELANVRARGSQVVWIWFVSADLAVLVATQVATSCAIAAVILLSVGLLVYAHQLRSQRLDIEAVLRCKRSELSQLDGL
jgi:DNA-directed RNA polymerase subunit RPC12/RpoP